MSRLNLIRMVLFVGVFSACAPLTVAQHEHPSGDPTKLGKVNFPVSCEASVQAQFTSAVAMLHSFWYEKAKDTFSAVAEKDPACGMAYWGIAMTYYHPIWQAPGSADLKAGTTYMEKAKVVSAKTQRERDYIAAIEVFYRDSDKIDHATRALAYEKAMEQLQARYPDDHEAAIFHALALLATAPLPRGSRSQAGTSSSAAATRRQQATFSTFAPGAATMTSPGETEAGSAGTQPC